MRARRIAGAAVALAAAAAVAAALALPLGVALTLPQARATLWVPGLSAPVAVSFDSHGVPRIRAASEADAAAALGAVHARDRLFQMELMRRAASGRLAEIAGPAALPLDRLARTLGERRHAEAAWAGMPPGPRVLLLAYARGVNAMIAARGRFASPELLALGRPEPWTPVDSLLWGETVSMWLSGNYRTELARLALSARLSPERVLDLWPPAPPGSPLAALLPPGSPSLPAALPRFPAPFTWPDEASDEWAVDGAHSATGAPLLAGDPHLGFGFPAIWYLARIETPERVLVGATAPGVPFLVLGRNGSLAWTFTSTGADTQDVFVETVLPDGTYRTPEGPRPFARRQERIRVRGGRDVVITVRQTRHGPVISDLDPVPGGPVLAVQMAQMGPGSGAEGLYALNRAGSVQEAGAAAAAIAAPVQNLLAADRARIGLFTTGRVPLRRAGDGSLPVPGADGGHDWTGLAAGAALPHVVDPPGGRLLNANDRTAPPDFPVFMGRDWDWPWRAGRIRELLLAAPRAGLGDFTAWQADDRSLFARRLLPALLAVPRPGGLPDLAASLLDHWDGRMDTDLPQPLIFNAWVQRFVSLVLLGSGVPEQEAGPWEAFAAHVLSPEGASWCAGGCTALLKQALAEAASELADQYGPDPASWRWGAAHRAVFAHPLLARLPGLGGAAARAVAVPGDDTTLFRGGNGELGAFTALHGAEYRGAYDLADPERSRFVVAPGQSGNILSPHAWDMLALWARGATIPLGPTPDRVTATMRLVP